MFTTLIIYTILIAVAIACLFHIEVALCSLADIMYQAMEKFAGMTQVKYKGEDVYLIEVFFKQHDINMVYWGMAVIGIVLLFGFTIVGVIKKIFDVDDKNKSTYGSILGSALKAFVIILSMNFILSASILATNVLLQQISFIFANAPNLGEPREIVFTDKHFAQMAQALDKIGNYSLTPSRTNRYNVNSCFNEIRSDLRKLDEDGIFDYDYSEYAATHGDSWQSVLEEIAISAYLGDNLDVNEYNEGVTKAMEHAFNAIDKNNNFYPLQSFKISTPVKAIENGNVPMGAMLFMSASFDAAVNEKYNGTNASFTDPVRKPYIQGKKNYKSQGSITKDFDFLTGFNHITLIVSTIFVLREFLAILINCVARIFNLLLLYIVAPPFVATMPMDDGAKFKQWTLAFTIQSLSVVGQVIMIRLYIMFVPIIMSSDVVIFSNGTANGLCKVVFMVGAAIAAKEATGLFTGILAEQAGMSAIRAGDVGGKVAKAAGEMASGLVGAGVGVAAGVVGMGVKPAVAAIEGPKGGGGGGGARGGGSSGGGSGGGAGGGGQQGPAQIGGGGTSEGGESTGGGTSGGGSVGGGSTGGGGSSGGGSGGGAGGGGQQGPAQIAGGGTSEGGESTGGGTSGGGSVGGGSTGGGSVGGGSTGGGSVGGGSTGGGSFGGGESAGGSDPQGPAQFGGDGEDFYDDNPADEEYEAPGRGAYAKDAAIDALKDVGYSALAAGKEGLSAMSRVANMAMTGDADSKALIDSGTTGKDLKKKHQESQAEKKHRSQKMNDKAKANFDAKNRQIPTQSSSGPGNTTGNAGPAGFDQEDSNDDNPSDEEYHSPGKGEYVKDTFKDSLADVGYSTLAAGKEGLSAMSRIANMAMTGDADSQAFIESGTTGQDLKKKHQESQNEKAAKGKKLNDKYKANFDSKNRKIPKQ